MAESAESPDTPPRSAQSERPASARHTPPAVAVLRASSSEATRLGSPPAGRAEETAPGLPTASLGPLDKEVYEYIPDPALSLAPQNSQTEELSRSTSRAFRGRRNDVDDDSIEPSVAFETFRGKTYKTTQFNQGFAKQPAANARKTRAFRDYDASPEVEVTRVGSKGPGDGVKQLESMSIFELGNTCFETPLGRLQRLRMEVEEMLDFVSSFIVRENVDEASLEDTEKTTDGGAAGSGSRTMYTQKILTPEEKQTLLFGRDPLSLMGELDCLRMQILSVMNDPSLQRLFAGVEPTTGKKSGTQLLLQHLTQVKLNLTSVAGACSKSEEEKQPEKNANGEAHALPAGTSTAPSAGSASGEGTVSTQYDIYCVPSLRPLLDSGRVATLERRLAQVEGRIGMSNISLLPFADLQQAVSSISQKISLLDQNKVEQLHKRTQSLLHELHALQHRRREIDLASSQTSGRVSEGRSGQDGEERESALATRNSHRDDQRVEEMFDLCERWKGTAAALPSVVERLQALKALHQEAGGLSVRLGVLEEQQGELQAMLAAAEENVENLQHTVLETVSWARNTVEALQWRLQRLGFADEKNIAGKSEKSEAP
ncbi:GH23102, related [Neospora caninum Liverpool]|uniref:GH23102, related n=1 Tax=Neospora caninum (strain Liverpool) TaxID=572307 RepID=F0VQC8_NEOCL|nr:GH23102, related [Neospora caninum Liverpool]CBZ55925.1 GH23102, related [Neospora caninum Liverpool]CEL70668.1 TPA: GH23102, related [Neospora caninum Liverpool]|eukprot:XP_003885951.1 GH23102, related [Neospora caninum Liverpool]